MFWRVLYSQLGFSSQGLGKLNFCQIFDWFLLLICIGCWPLVVERICIKGGFHDIHALFHIVVHNVHARCLIKCLLGIFLLVWTLMSIKLWGFSCFLIRNMFGSLVMYLTHLAPHMHFSCIGHALHIANFYTHLCYPCHALVYTLLCLFLTKRGRVYSREYIEVFLSFLFDSCAHPQGEKFYFLCTFVREEIFHRGDAYTKREKTLC